MTRRGPGGPAADDGAILIIALVVVTVLGLATVAIAEFGFTVPKAGAALSARERLTNALDTAVAANTEQVRLGSVAGCPSNLPAVLANVDGLAAAGPPVIPAIDVKVTCSVQSGLVTLVAARDCPDPVTDAPTLEVKLAVSPGTTATPAVVLVKSRRVLAGVGCPSP